MKSRQIRAWSLIMIITRYPRVGDFDKFGYAAWMAITNECPCPMVIIII